MSNNNNPANLKPHPEGERGGEGRKRGHKHIGDQIRYIRKGQNLTLLQLAEKIGCKYQQLQRIELTGKGSIRSLEEISNALQHALFIWPKINLYNNNIVVYLQNQIKQI